MSADEKVSQAPASAPASAPAKPSARFLFLESATASKYASQHQHLQLDAGGATSRAASALNASTTEADRASGLLAQSTTLVNDASTSGGGGAAGGPKGGASGSGSGSGSASEIQAAGGNEEDAPPGVKGYGADALANAAEDAAAASDEKARLGKGESRIDMPTLGKGGAGAGSDDEDAESDGAPAPAMQQDIYLPDEDLQVTATFWAVSVPRVVAWYASGLLTAGLLLLFGYWFPLLRLRAIARPLALRGALAREMTPAQVARSRWPWVPERTLVCMRTKHSLDIVPLRTMLLPTPMPLAEAFPPSLKVPFESAAAAAQGIRPAAADEKGAQGSAGSSISDEKRVRAHEAEGGPAALTAFQSVEHRYTTFLLSPAHARLVPLAAWRDARTWTSLDAVARAHLAPEDVARRQAFFGKNLQQVKGKSIPLILVDEILHPFLVFTLCAIALWSYDDYQWYALIIGIVTIAGVSVSTTTAKRAYNRMERLSAFTCRVSAWRGGAWTVVESSELVPGDVIDLSAQGEAAAAVLACDAALLQGGVIVNESMLTGEAMPVAKTPVSNADLKRCVAAGEDLTQISKHVLFSGTKVLRVAAPLAEGAAGAEAGGASASEDAMAARCTALVVRTGFNTTRGSLIRAMMFPKPIKFRFYTDCAWFILFLVVIAVLGFLGSLVRFIEFQVDPTEIALRALDLFTICVPPAIPAAQAAVIAFALARLRKRGIACTSPQRINVSGRVNLCAFDKTGTLTHTDLDVLGTRASALGAQNLTELQTAAVPVAVGAKGESESNAAEASAAEGVTLTEGLATAHDLSEVDGTLIGEPLEVKMFEFSGWSLDSVAAGLDVQVESDGEAGAGAGAGAGTTDAGPARTADGVLATATLLSPPGGAGARRAIVKKYDFVSALRRMSVLVRREGSADTYVYCKGAPEQVEAVCDARTLPADLNAVLGHYTHAGYRVLALAGKRVPNLGWGACQRMRRAEAEAELTFLGLLIFENRLKDGTAPALAKLQEAGIPCKMVTGDSALTAIAVAKEAGMVSAAQPVFVARLAGGEGADAELEWVDAQHADSTLDPYSLVPRNGSLRLADVGLAMTGETFRHLLAHGARETRERALLCAQVFARMSPEQKQELVEQLQALQYTVAFCGDGANDCGALKQADVGVSLSEAESSVAAPFTSRTEDISCMDGLIREGRSCLQTSCTSVLFLAIYSITEYFSVILLYLRFTSFDNAEYLFIDVFIVLSVMLGLANSHPAERLAKWAPSSRLMSRRLIITLVGHVGLMMLAQAVIFVTLPTQPDYAPPDFEPTDLQLNDMDNSAIFRISLFPYLISTACFSVGPPHRQVVWRNALLFAALSVLLVFATFFLFLTGGPFYTLFGFVDLPRGFRWVLFGTAAGYAAATLAFHFLLVGPLTKAAHVPVRWIRKARGAQEQKRFVLVRQAVEAGR